MERTMSVEDKIRRAEEIYNRRRENENKVTSARVRVDNTKEINNNGINQRLKKMIIQIVVCMGIYLIFYYIVNNNYIFSEDFRTKCEEILSYDISFNEMYKKISEAITVLEQNYQKMVDNSEQNDDKNQEEQQKNVDQHVEEQNNTEVKQNTEKETNEQEQLNKNEDENIGGAVEEVANLEQISQTLEDTNIEEKEELSEEEQMKNDSEEIKSKISFIKPLEGTITSRFGWRNPTVSTVSKYHTGIDIAADEGTNIIAATSGKVVLSSSTGAYGNHLKIEVEDIIILYAHCLSLEVKEGDEVTQGQVIAKVGSTGNSTGPHLHFEIRKNDRYVDPDLILDF